MYLNNLEINLRGKNPQNQDLIMNFDVKILQISMQHVEI